MNLLRLLVVVPLLTLQAVSGERLTGYGDCVRQQPVCPSPSVEVTRSNTEYNCDTDINFGCLSPYGELRPIWLYFSVTTGASVAMTLGTSLSSVLMDLDYVLWGPFDYPGICGAALGTPIACSNVYGTSAEQLNIPSPSSGRFYIMMVNALNITYTDSIAISLAVSSGNLNCNLPKFHLQEHLYASAQQNMVVTGTALTGQGDQVAIVASGISCTTAIDPTTVPVSNVVPLDLTTLSGEYKLCLKIQGGSYSDSLSSLFTVVDVNLARSDLDVSSSQSTSISLSGTAISEVPMVEVIASGSSCAEQAFDRAVKVSASSSLVDFSGLLPGPYRVCFQYQGQWSNGMSAPLNVASSFYISSPSTRLAAQTFGAQFSFAGTAVASGGEIAVVDLTQSCSGLNPASALLIVAVAADGLASLDLRNVVAGSYRICFEGTGGFTDAFQDEIKVVGLSSTPRSLVSAKGQSITFQGPLVNSNSDSVALIPAAEECTVSAASSAVVVSNLLGPQIEEQENILLNADRAASVDLTGVSPGVYKWCFLDTSPPFNVYTNGVSTYISVASSLLTVSPTVWSQSPRATLTFAGAVVEGAGDEVTLIASTQCSEQAARNPLGVSSAVVASPTATAVLDFSGLPVGFYTLCYRPVGTKFYVGQVGLSILGLQSTPSQVLRGDVTVTFSGHLVNNPGEEVALITTEQTCSLDGATSAVRFGLPGNTTKHIDLQFANTVAADYRLCFRDSEPPFNTYQDGVETSLVIVPEFTLTRIFYTKDPASYFEVQGLALTSSGDILRVVRQTASCSSAAILSGPRDSAFDFSALAPEIYKVCLYVAGNLVADSGLSAVFHVLGFYATSQSVMATPTTTLTFGGSLVNSNLDRVAIIPAIRDCSTGVLEDNFVNGAGNKSLTLDLSGLEGGLHKVCFKDTVVPYNQYLDGAYYSIMVTPAVKLASTEFAQSEVAILELQGALVDPVTLPGQVAIIDIGMSCSRAAGASAYKYEIPPEKRVMADFTNLATGQYALCFKPTNGLFNDDLFDTFVVLGFKIDSSTTVSNVAGTQLNFTGYLVDSNSHLLTEVTVVPLDTVCDDPNAIGSRIRSPLLMNGSATLDLSTLNCAVYKVCFRGTRVPYTQYRPGRYVTIHVIQSLYPAFYPDTISAGLVQSIRFIGKGLDLRPNQDRVKIVENPENCNQGAFNNTGTISMSFDLGPGDSNSSMLGYINATVPYTGMYTICYRLAGTSVYEPLPTRLRAIIGITRFTGKNRIAMEYNNTQWIYFEKSGPKPMPNMTNTTDETTSSHHRIALEVEPEDGTPMKEWKLKAQTKYRIAYPQHTQDPSNLTNYSIANERLAIVYGTNAAQVPFGGCNGGQYMYGPVVVVTNFVIATFSKAGPYTLCYAPAGEEFFGAMGTFTVVPPGCADGGSYPRDQCDNEWKWLWPVVLGPIIILLGGAALWLYLVPRKYPGALFGLDKPYQKCEELTAQEMEAKDRQQEAEIDLLKRHLDAYRKELHAVQSIPPPPPEIRRVEVPMERVIEKPVTVEVQKPVTVEKVVEVTVEKVVEKEVVRIEETPVERDRLVMDPTMKMQLEWANQDCALLKKELEDKINECEALKYELERVTEAFHDYKARFPSSGRKGAMLSAPPSEAM